MVSLQDFRFLETDFGIEFCHIDSRFLISQFINKATTTLGCKHGVCVSLAPLPDGKPDRAGKTCNISHCLWGALIMRGGAHESEWERWRNK